MSLGQALNLVNGPTVADAIRAPGNEIAELVRYERDDRRVLEELYLRFLCRPPTAAERDALVATLDPAVRANRAALSPEDAAELERRFAAWQAAVPRVEWHPPLSGTARSEGGATLAREDDGSFRASGAAPEQDRTMLALWTERVGITGLRLEVLPDEELPGRGPGRADNGNFVLNELSLTAVPLRAPGEARVVELVGATADFSQDGFPVADAIDGKPETGWAVSPRLGVPHEAVFETGTDVGAEGGTLLVLTLAQQYGGRHTLGRLRVSVTTSARPVRHHGLPPDVAAALGVAPPERSEAELDLIHRHFVATDREMADRIRLGAAQDLAWALANSPGFLFNR